MSKGRASFLEALISRRPEPDGQRRVDFKGERRRFSLRLPTKTVIDLEIIKVATGEDKNAFVERHLDEAVQQKMKELKAKHGTEAWDFIVARASSRVL